MLDAYCGIGTIGLIAASKAKQVTGVELNKEAVRDAIKKCKAKIRQKNITFYCEDAGEFMLKMAAEDQQLDVVFMDPPRSGSSEVFLDCLSKLAPKRWFMFPVIRKRWQEIFAF